MFYLIFFGCLAVLLVAAAVTAVTRRRTHLEVAERRDASTSRSVRRKRKAERAQSQHDRRKRH
jgi:hypothetical protein